MSVAQLPDIAPSRSTRMASRLRVNTLRFGGGHRLYIREGGAEPDTEWNVVWQTLSQAESQSLTAFFKAQGGIKPFIWTPPGATQAEQFLCPEWQLTPQTADHFQLNARFIRY